MLANPVEWLETDGRGGFSQGTSTGVRNRRYHALLVVPTKPPVSRMVLVNGCEVFVDTAEGFYALSSDKYAPGITHPDGLWRIESFVSSPWPTWTYQVGGRYKLQHELFVKKGSPLVVLTWRVIDGDSSELQLQVRPFVSGRGLHELHRKNSQMRTASFVKGKTVSWRPYDKTPTIVALSNGEYSPSPEWYYGFVYDEERARGYCWEEDLNSPGIFRFSLTDKPAELVFTAAKAPAGDFADPSEVEGFVEEIRLKERQRRQQFQSPLHLAADSYLVQGVKRKTVIAGYPWFGDWGRDTFIALRGLCLATGRLEDARDIFLGWLKALKQGMIPNLFCDDHGRAEYNSVDASLWFIIAANDFLEAGQGRLSDYDETEAELLRAVAAIIKSYVVGTYYRVKCDEDGLLACGVEGQALTWMDAKIDRYPVTPRIGKPVEVQALWLNSLFIATQRLHKFQELYERGADSFASRFWNSQKRYYNDVVDVDHWPGVIDDSFRANQIFAVGGLGVSLLDKERARRVVEAVEARLLTPYGLRTLGSGEPGYRGHYQGGCDERDRAYHQGTVWPWLIGPFVEAWLKVHGETAENMAEAYRRFLKPLLVHLDQAGVGHVSEIFDAEPGHAPRGSPFQAWSLGELLRLKHKVLPSVDDVVV